MSALFPRPATLDRSGDYEPAWNEYLGLLTRRLPLVVAIAVVAALLGFTVSLLTPKTYEARTSLLVTRPQYALAVDPKFQGAGALSAADQVALLKGVAALALTDEVLRPVLEKITATSGVDAQALESFRGDLSVITSLDLSTLALSARARDPQEAADVANVWAEELKTRVQDVYGLSQGDVSYLQAKLTDADTRLAQANAALAAFQGKNQLGALTNHLAAVQKEQVTYLAEREAVTRLQTDIEGLRKRIDSYPPEVRVAAEDEISLLLLQTRVYGGGPATSGVGVPSVQLQLGGAENLPARKASEVSQSLEALDAHLTAKARTIDDRVASLAQEISEMQAKLTATQSEADRLVLERDAAKGTYTTLDSAVGSARLTEGAEGQVTVVGQASAPIGPVAPSKKLYTGVSGFLGLLIGVCAAFAWGLRARAGGR